MGFYDRMEEEVTKKLTENGSPSFSSSLNKNLDFFALAGAARTRSSEEIMSKFGEAYRENRETALRNLVYLRGLREFSGLGERDAFRHSVDFIIRYKVSGYEKILMGLVSTLPAFGRWDDVVDIFKKSSDLPDLRKLVAITIASQLNQDVVRAKAGESISLLAKWLPSEQTSSKETKRTARTLIRYLYNSSGTEAARKYRKLLSALRRQLNVVETKMSAQEWHDIEYSSLPSLAALKYKHAFMRHDTKRYQDYLDKLETGETKVNASVTYPYEIVREYEKHGLYGTKVDTLLENAWKSLPDYIGDSDERAIVVADTSGSMMVTNNGLPMQVSISLAMYCAQRLKGEFAGKYISFSGNPALNTVHPDATLLENIRSVRETDWSMNTDIDKVFNLILKTAVDNQMSQEELPNKIVIISDMEFDQATRDKWGVRSFDRTNYQNAKRQFAKYGYKLPQIIFWNVDARNDTLPVQKDEIGTALVSGLSPSIFKSVLSGDILNPEQMMLDTLYQDKYNFVAEWL